MIIASCFRTPVSTRRLRVAPPETMRGASHGEVLVGPLSELDASPRPANLFSIEVFGPLSDDVARSTRFGHIELAVRVRHPAAEPDAEDASLSVIPVLPPGLRPAPAAGWAVSDLDVLYGRLLDRNARLKKLIALRSRGEPVPQQALDDEERMLARAMEHLLANGLHHTYNGPQRRPLLSLRDLVERALAEGRAPDPYLRAMALEGELD